MAKTEKLNHRQSKFVDAYLLDPCATRAAKEAGYSAKSAYSIGSGLLKNPLVVEAIRRVRAESNEQSGLDRDYVIRNLQKVVKKYDRLKQGSVVVRALELLGKLEGMFDERVRTEITGKDGGPIEYSDYTDDELRESLKRTATRIAESGKSN